jgi:hypothetical protein
MNIHSLIVAHETLKGDQKIIIIKLLIINELSLLYSLYFN